MLYQNNKKVVVPDKLLNLFTLHYKDIILNNYSHTYEIVDEYKVADKILNTKISQSFSEALFSYIKDSEVTYSSIYKKAFIDKRLFSKIKSNADYHPSFGTVTLLALALELSTEEYINLLNSASYSLPQNSYVNITLKYCFDNKIYNVFDVDGLLYTVAEKVLKDL
jgi:hypothetical protein